MCMAEMGVHWPSIPSEDRIWERTSSWFDDRRLAVSYNSKDTMVRRTQYGGTAIMAINAMANKVYKCGYDNSGLGRWSWMVIQGKYNTFTRIVSAYCPVKSTAKGTKGQYTVYAQQLQHWEKDPIAKFWEDLGNQLLQWRDNEENLIICGDWNTSITSPTLRGFMSVYGLQEAITYVHGQNPPPTYHRGQDSIDGIFVSRNFLGIQGGYLEYGDAPGDHRGIWVDIPHTTLFGHKMPNVPPKQIRNLQCRHSKSTKRYTEEGIFCNL